MSSVTSNTAPNNGQSALESFQALWSKAAPFVVPPIAATVGYLPAARDFSAKADKQLGNQPTRMSVLAGCRAGLAEAPLVGGIVGVQMVLQNVFEKTFFGENHQASVSSKLMSSTLVGLFSAPPLAVFNAKMVKKSAQEAGGKLVAKSTKEILKKLSRWEVLAIVGQESTFVGGLSLAGPLSEEMKHLFGNNKAVEYSTAFTTGAMGSLAGHPFNTALTRWQNGKLIEHPRQLMWGAAYKARAVGVFSMFYKALKDALNQTVTPAN